MIDHIREILKQKGLRAYVSNAYEGAILIEPHTPTGERELKEVFGTSYTFKNKTYKIFYQVVGRGQLR